MADNEEQDFSKLSIEDRVSHKNWKARVSGYEELAKLFPTYEDKEFNRFCPLVKKFILDTNAAAQEKGLSAVLPFVDYCPVAGKYVDGIMTGITTKCLNSSRAKTKELAVEIVLMCVEIERQDVVLEELIKGLEQKTPKNVAAVVRMIRTCLAQFGSKVITIKSIVPVLSKLLEDRDPTVREETKLLTVEIYRWVKDALLPQLSNLKPILLESLQSEFEKVKPQKASPERLLRSQQQRNEANTGDDVDGAGDGTNGGDGDGQCAEEEEVDPFELMEAVDIVAKLPSDFYTLLDAKKWQERKDGLEKLQQLLEQHPKLMANADYADLIKTLKRVITKDTNIVVATTAVKCLYLLANGLRKNFHPYANSCAAMLLEKFKEKKANVVAALREAIDAVYVATSLEAIQEDLTTALENKNPSVRSETALFLARSFAKTNPNLVNKKLLKTLVTALLKTLSDPDLTVRESSAEALGTAAKAQGDRNMTPLLQGLEQLKMAKIDEYKAKVEVKKFASVPVAPPSQQSSTAQSSSSSAQSNKQRTIARKPASSSARATSKTQAAATHGSSVESLTDLGPDPPASAPPPVKRPTASKFGTIKSRLDTGTTSVRSSDSATSSTGGGGTSKYSTVKRSGTGVRGGGIGNKSSQASSTSSTATSTMASKKSDDSSGAGASPLMCPGVKAKEQRAADERALKVLKWNFTSPREEFYTQLREQMTAAEFNTALITNLFHSDFKYHIKAIDQIRDFFLKDSTIGTECVIANIDLILKWIALRFFDTNPSVIMKALELLLVMFRLLEQANYSMTDMEANSFFPYLVLKVGDPKDVVRNKVHEILIKLRNLYPANKIFAHLFAGLQSKNSRQRATCLEEIAQLIELKGMAIFQQPNSITVVKDIAKFLSERDNGVRNGALNCIVQVYFFEGEKVLKLVGNLSDKEMSLIEERIKRASKQQPPPSAAAARSLTTGGGGGGGDSNIGGGGSGLPTLGAGGGLPQRFASSSRLYPQQQQSNTDQESSNTNSATISRSGGVSKISSLSNLRAQLAQMEAHANGGGGGALAHSPYVDPQQQQQHFGMGTYSKSRTPGGGGGGGSAAALRSRLALGGKSSSLVGFGVPGSTGSNIGGRAISGGGGGGGSMPVPNVKLDFDSQSDSDQQQQHSDSEYSGAADGGCGGTTTGADFDTDSILASGTEAESDLDRRVREALALPDLPTSSRLRQTFARHRSPNSSNSSDSSSTTSSAHTGFSPLSPLKHRGHRTSPLGNGGGAGAGAGASPPSSSISSLSPQQQRLNAELSQKFAQLFTDLSSTELKTVFKALEHLNNALKQYDKYSAYLEPNADQLIVLENKQFRLFMSKYYPEAGDDEQQRLVAESIFRAVAAVLHKVFNLPLGKRISRDTLRELITHLLPYFIEMREIKRIFNSVNVIIYELIKGADATNLLTALIRMLHDYVGCTARQNQQQQQQQQQSSPSSTTSSQSSPSTNTSSQSSPSTHLETYLELTMKFIWRMVKVFDNHIENLNIDMVLYESHLFFKSYPRSWWRENFPTNTSTGGGGGGGGNAQQQQQQFDLPIRTIKTLVYLIVREKGDSILSHFTLIENKDESELSYYVQKSLRQCESSLASNRSTTSNHNNNNNNIGGGGGGTGTPCSNISTSYTVDTSSASIFNNGGGGGGGGGGGANGTLNTPSSTIGGGGGGGNHSTITLNGNGNLMVEHYDDENVKPTPASSSSSMMTPNGAPNSRNKMIAVGGGGGGGVIPQRVFAPDFPLKTRQLNENELMIGTTTTTAADDDNQMAKTATTTTTIPIIRTEDDLRKYCDYTAAQLNIELNYDSIRAKAIPARSLEEAEQAVKMARERLLKLQSLISQEGQ